MEEFITKSEDEANEFFKELVSMKNESAIEILKFINNHNKFSSKEILLATMSQRQVSYDDILEFMELQENAFNRLADLLNEYPKDQIDFESIIQKKEKLASEFEIVHTLLFSFIKDLYILSCVKPTLERMEKGKTPKAKKQDQLLAEDWAQDIWKKDPTITQENMAYQLKDKLDLKQSIRTIQNWIKPFQPKP